MSDLEKLKSDIGKYKSRFDTPKRDLCFPCPFS